MNGDCAVNTFSSGLNLHTIGAFDRWFEHAGFVNGTFFDSEKPGCVLSETSSCSTPTGRGGVWSGRGDGYDTSTIANVTIEVTHTPPCFLTSLIGTDLLCYQDRLGTNKQT